MLIESIVSVFAPERCVGCGRVGLGLCVLCSENLEHSTSRCYRCHRVSLQSQVCQKCRKSVKLKHVWVVCNYEGLSKELIHKLKFERSGYLSREIATLIAEKLPILDRDTIICHVPTASNHIRLRGYDQALLIARDLAKITGLKHQDLFTRTTKLRQVGASRQQRYKQAELSYEISKKVTIKGKKVLLVDDVLTSGATLETLANLLHKNGVGSVDVAVFAQAID